jgi:hypothetical protein
MSDEFKMNKCTHIPGAVLTVAPDSEFTDKQIDAKRLALARQWRVSKDTVADYEAIAMLRQETAKPNPGE